MDEGCGSFGFIGEFGCDGSGGMYCFLAIFEYLLFLIKFQSPIAKELYKELKNS